MTSRSTTRSLALVAAVLGGSMALAASPASASILIDNTANGTATIGSNASFLTQDSREQGLLFTVAAGYTLNITTIKVYIAGGSNVFDVTLWYPSGDFIGIDRFTNSGTGWRDFTLTDSAFSNIGAGQYWLSLGYATDLIWYATDPEALPTAVTGLTVDGYQFTNNYGASRATSNTYNAIQINGSLTFSGGVVPGGGLACLSAGGLASLAGRRRRRA